MHDRRRRGRAVAGDTVLVHTGTYAEQVTVLSSGTARAADHLRRGPRGHGDGAGRRERVPDQLEELRHGPWVHRRGHDRTRHQRDPVGAHHDRGQRRQRLRARRPWRRRVVAGASRSPPRPTRSYAATSPTTTPTPASSSGLGSTGNVIAGNTSSSNARGYARAAVGIDVRGATNRVNANVVFDNEDSGINIWDGRDQPRRHEQRQLWQR